MSDSDVDFDSKAQFIEAVRDERAVLDGIEYFTEGEGTSTSYHARTEDGEVEDITKSDVEDAWDQAQGEGEAVDEGAEGEEPEEVHLGTFYYSKSNWHDNYKAELQDALDDLGWEIAGEVSSGGYRIHEVKGEGEQN